KVAKQLNSIVNQTIAITVKHYERIIGLSRSPRQMLSDTYAVKVEIYSVVVGAHLKAITCHVHNDW
ncbi:MAG: hypothetical protein ABI698_01240, partial [bacterium]